MNVNMQPAPFEQQTVLSVHWKCRHCVALIRVTQSNPNEREVLSWCSGCKAWYLVRWHPQVEVLVDTEPYKEMSA